MADSPGALKRDDHPQTPQKGTFSYNCAVATPPTTPLQQRAPNFPVSSGFRLSPPSYPGNSGDVQSPSRVQSQLRHRNQVLAAEAERARQQLEAQQRKIEDYEYQLEGLEEDHSAHIAFLDILVALLKSNGYQEPHKTADL